MNYRCTLHSSLPRVVQISASLRKILNYCLQLRNSHCNTRYKACRRIPLVQHSTALKNSVKDTRLEIGGYANETRRRM